MSELLVLTGHSATVAGVGLFILGLGLGIMFEQFRANLERRQIEKGSEYQSQFDTDVFHAEILWAARSERGVWWGFSHEPEVVDGQWKIKNALDYSGVRVICLGRGVSIKNCSEIPIDSVLNGFSWEQSLVKLTPLDKLRIMGA